MAARKWIQTSIAVPRNWTDNQNILAGQFIIEKIRERTRSGIDRYGKRFKAYTEEYRNSLDFRNANKTNQVNLTQSGDTLANLSVISIRPGLITVGYPDGDEQAEIVEGLQLQHGREFIGLPQSEVDLIIAQVETDSVPDQIRRSLIDEIAEGLLSRLL